MSEQDKNQPVVRPEVKPVEVKPLWEAPREADGQVKR